MGRRRQIGQRRVQVRLAVIDDAGERGQSVVELHDLDVAVAQRADEGLQVLMMSTMLPLPLARMRPTPDS
ncbi:hypothetical protein O982_25640 [Mycobacterium avium 10-5581]|nr:hypothetical protein O982_25640 [Mycobacterium avium 10-5581]